MFPEQLVTIEGLRVIEARVREETVNWVQITIENTLNVH